MEWIMYSFLPCGTIKDEFSLPFNSYGLCNYFQHEDHGVGSGAFPNDIAVIEFDTPVTGDYIEAVPMANTGAEHAGMDDCVITGWGYTLYGGK